ncbi:MAG: histone deacetylase [Anaerolineales bacterium]|nr:histone deacetylase [Anaerolineales bacterium]
MRTAWTYVPAPEHSIEDHPENPARLSLLPALFQELDLPPALDVKLAAPEEIAEVHKAAMIRTVESACAQGPVIIDYAPTYVTSTSYVDALLAAGTTLACARAVVNGEADNGFSIVRPPGHHAEPDRAMGFCLFNNQAVAVRDALKKGVERVMIVDYDAHHGNGTQAVFLQDERVAFVSTHQAGIYPGTGRVEEIPHARGRMVNMPMTALSGDQSYQRVIDEVVKPLVESFQPRMIFVSAGFDSHWDDPLTMLGLSTSGFFSISQRLVQLAGEHCQGKILFLLEGGYNPHSIANGVHAVFAALDNQDAPDVEDVCPYADPDVGELVNRVRQFHQMR